ncbi:hypothetical protein C1T06_22915 [Vibrio parahaemolyticus]|nr:hypothetical protein C1T06_22915 [Vibrio parahaemolyticus]
MKFKYEKRLCIIAAIVMLVVIAIEWYMDTLSVHNTLGLLFSLWLCIGSWHVLDDKAKGETVWILDLYAWPRRYLKGQKK